MPGLDPVLAEPWALHHGYYTTTLYFPALAAIKSKRGLKPFRDALLARGKPKMLAIGAGMRKLIHIVYGVLISDTFFDPSFLAKSPKKA